MNLVFDNITELPNNRIKTVSESLVGFQTNYSKLFSSLNLFFNHDKLREWSLKHYNQEIPAISYIQDRYPLVILAGDAGTGKTVTAESIADSMTRELKKEGFFLKLNTKVRGEGLHGQMGGLINDAFDELKKQAGKNRLAFLLIDEADAIASTRATTQMHQEEKAAVNTLIQKIDGIRELKGRAVVFMSTNRLHYIDEAILRRAAYIMEFERPNDRERIELFENDLSGLNFTKEQLKELSVLTGPAKNKNVGYSFSDLRLRVIPEAIASSFPSTALSFDIILSTLKKVKPSPIIK